MKKMLKKKRTGGKAVKARHWQTVRGRKKTAKKRRAAKIATVLVLRAAFTAAAACFLTADRNSLAVGWGKDRTELAFALTSDTAELTVMGQTYYVDTAAFKAAGHVCSQVHKGAALLQPPPVRLLDMVCVYLKGRIAGMLV